MHRICKDKNFVPSLSLLNCDTYSNASNETTIGHGVLVILLISVIMSSAILKLGTGRGTVLYWQNYGHRINLDYRGFNL